MAHLRRWPALGVTTVEAKSGYGLTLEHELRLLEVYRAAGRLGPADRPHVARRARRPAEFRDRRAEYVALVEQEIFRGWRARDWRGSATSSSRSRPSRVQEARRILDGGTAARPAAQAARRSAHRRAVAPSWPRSSARPPPIISRASPKRASAPWPRAGVVAVSLPFASLYLGADPLPARRLLEAGVPVAVATDFNPGSAPSYHLPMALTLACTLQRMTPAEALERRDRRRRPRDRSGVGDRLARAGQGGGFRGDRCRLGRAMALPSAPQRLRADGRARQGDLEGLAARRRVVRVSGGRARPGAAGQVFRRERLGQERGGFSQQITLRNGSRGIARDVDAPAAPDRSGAIESPAPVRRSAAAPRRSPARRTGGPLPCGDQRLFPVERRDDRVAPLLEGAHDQPADLGLVLRQQDGLVSPRNRLGFSGRLPAASARPPAAADRS